MSKAETIRRLRLGNLRTLFRNRYGTVLPDDDVGREDMRELLLPVSIDPNADIKMLKMIEIWAPWMSSAEAEHLVDQINRTPIYQRKPDAERLGFRQQVTNQERERLRLWTIAPYDMTVAERKEQRRAKAAARKRRLRQKHGSKPRAIYEAESKSKIKPWEKQGISRRTWYRKNRGTGPSLSNASIEAEDALVPSSKRQVREVAVRAYSDSQKLSSCRKRKPSRTAERKSVSTDVLNLPRVLRTHLCQINRGRG
jgi:hypothetical protein